MSAVSTFGWWAQIITQNREMMHFLPRPSGIIILFTFIESEIQQREGAGHPETFAEIGHRFGVSRSHVRNLVTEAEEAGLMERNAGDERHVRITPRCAAAFDRFVAEHPVLLRSGGLHGRTSPEGDGGGVSPAAAACLHP